MRQLTLKEYEPRAPVALSIEQRDALKELVPSLNIVPDRGSEHCYILTPGSDVGAVFLPELAIEIRPKIPIDRVLFLISYALDPRRWQQIGFGFGKADSLVEAIVPGFVAQLRRALFRGLLQGYRRQEEALMTVRGRIRFEEQMRRHNGIAPPIEVVYDEFTEDIVENQLLKAAVERFRHMHLRSEYCRRSLRHFEYVLQQVSSVHFDPRHLPTITYSRLNEHYRPALTLAKMILRSSSIELRHGSYQATAFLVNMNEVFENFVTVALRDALGLTERQFCQNAQGHKLHLDSGKRIALQPDLYWFENNRCVFLGDVKYKRINDAAVKHADLYQILAYTIAANVPSGLLIYAAGAGEPAHHHVSMAGKTLEVHVLDVSETPDDILRRVAVVVRAIQRQRGTTIES